jgi:MFS family permease
MKEIRRAVDYVNVTARRILLPALALTVMVVAVLQTLVVPVIAQIGATLQVSSSAVGWALTANLLAAAVLTPVLGRLGDVHGRRPVLLGILAVVAAGSLLAAVTTSLPLLILARVLQGASYGLFPLSMAVLRDELPAERLTGAMAVVSGTLGIGGGLGLVLTGLLTRANGDYHRIFWLSLAVTLAAMVLAAWTVPARRPDPTGARRTDWSGAVVLGLGLVLLLLPLSQGRGWGWTSLPTLGSFVGSAVVLLAWLRVEKQVRAPLVTPQMLRSVPLMATHAAGLFIGVAMFVGFLAVSGFVQSPSSGGYGFSASVLAASTVYLLPGALSGVVTAPLGGRLVQRFGGRATLISAALLGAAGFLLMALLHSSSWELIVGALAVNTAVSLGYAAMPALIVAEVAPSETGVANSVNSIARALGSSLASAVVVTLLASDVLPTGQPRESAYVGAFLLGAVGLLVAATLVRLGLPRLPAPAGEEAEFEAATAYAGEFATVGAR